MTLNQRRPRRRGSILPLVVLTMVAMCGFVALSIDLGLIAVAKTQCQNSADAAAMAGARALDGSTSQNIGDTSTPGTSKYIAQQTATANLVLNSAIPAANITLTVRGVALRHHQPAVHAQFPAGVAGQLQPGAGQRFLQPSRRRSPASSSTSTPASTRSSPSRPGPGRPPAARRGHRPRLLGVDEQRERPVELRVLPGQRLRSPPPSTATTSPAAATPAGPPTTPIRSIRCSAPTPAPAPRPNPPGQRLQRLPLQPEPPLPGGGQRQHAERQHHDRQVERHARPDGHAGRPGHGRRGLLPEQPRRLGGRPPSRRPAPATPRAGWPATSTCSSIPTTSLRRATPRERTTPVNVNDLVNGGSVDQPEHLGLPTGRITATSTSTGNWAQQPQRQFQGYTEGPGYWGKTFAIWPPDPSPASIDARPLRPRWKRSRRFSGAKVPGGSAAMAPTTGGRTSSTTRPARRRSPTTPSCSRTAPATPATTASATTTRPATTSSTTRPSSTGSRTAAPTRSRPSCAPATCMIYWQHPERRGRQPGRPDRTLRPHAVEQQHHQRRPALLEGVHRLDARRVARPDGDHPAYVHLDVQHRAGLPLVQHRSSGAIGTRSTAAAGGLRSGQPAST